eukprot:TRINITY_DN2964_c0_g1_i3.p1 TRINITY_DN2964_c0_g1~~TRINITY_DN2964_c0_g1_i3.p1  ORF type:complete len:159 (-),score=81.24 TRINITY_DN2964_c0_g1_i3:89-565(-)
MCIRDRVSTQSTWGKFRKKRTQKEDFKKQIKMSLKTLAAYCLVALSGKEPTADLITKTLKDGGVEANADDVNTVVNALKGKQLNEVITEGLKKVQTLSVGGGGGAAAPAPAAAATTAPAKKEEPKKKEEKVEEEDISAGGLFDDFQVVCLQLPYRLSF